MERCLYACRLYPVGGVSTRRTPLLSRPQPVEDPDYAEVKKNIRCVTRFMGICSEIYDAKTNDEQASAKSELRSLICENSMLEICPRRPSVEKLHGALIEEKKPRIVLSTIAIRPHSLRMLAIAAVANAKQPLHDMLVYHTYALFKDVKMCYIENISYPDMKTREILRCVNFGDIFLRNQAAAHAGILSLCDVPRIYTYCVCMRYLWSESCLIESRNNRELQPCYHCLATNYKFGSAVRRVIYHKNVSWAVCRCIEPYSTLQEQLMKPEININNHKNFDFANHRRARQLITSDNVGCLVNRWDDLLSHFRIIVPR